MWEFRYDFLVCGAVRGVDKCRSTRSFSARGTCPSTVPVGSKDMQSPLCAAVRQVALQMANLGHPPVSLWCKPVCLCGRTHLFVCFLCTGVFVRSRAGGEAAVRPGIRPVAYPGFGGGMRGAVRKLELCTLSLLFLSLCSQRGFFGSGFSRREGNWKTLRGEVHP